MVHIAPLVGAALFFSSLAGALPTAGSSKECTGHECSTSKYESNYESNYESSYEPEHGSNYGSYEEEEEEYYTPETKEVKTTSTPSEHEKTTTPMEHEQTTTPMEHETTTTPEEYEETTTPMEHEKTTTPMEHETTTTPEEPETTQVQSTSVTTSYETYTTPSYGSGHSYWGGSGYDDCVNQCIAQYGGKSMGGEYKATTTAASAGSKGTGSVHTVIVAPTKGVFRFVPFATNASVGDTIEFHWGASNHTVTKSSSLTPCNKSAEDPVFATGQQAEGFVFSQVVNDTNPTYYFCGTPTHCDKGMFGVINPIMAAPGAPTSLGGMMSSMAADDSDLSAYAAYSFNVTASNNAASSWGSNIDIGALPEWARSLAATNVLYTRAVLGMNGEVLKDDNSVDLASVSTTPLMLPMDITPALNAAAAGAAPAAATTGAVDAPVAAGAVPSETPAGPAPNGAASLASSRLLVAAFVVVATFFAM